MININEKKVCGFCGHGLGGGNLHYSYFYNYGKRKRLFKTLKREILKHIEFGYTSFVCGSNIGSDIVFAQAVLKLKKKYKDITLDFVINSKQDPFINKYRKYFEKIKGQATNISYCESNDECMKYIIDKSKLMIFLWNGYSNNRTYDGISYATDNKKIIMYVHFDF